jgi:hypothetical protein
MQEPHPRRVFVVHGRNAAARDAMFQFLTAIGLEPVSFEEVANRIGPNPPIGAVLNTAFDEAGAVIVLFTGDESARLGHRYKVRKPEKRGGPQSRMNVIFEAGMALGKYPDRTLLVQLGPHRPFTDIAGLHLVELDDSVTRREALIQRLAGMGCPASKNGNWSHSGNFEQATRDPDGSVRAIGFPSAAVLALAVLAGLLYWMFHLGLGRSPDPVRLVGEIETTQPVTVYIVGVPEFQYTQTNSGTLHTQVPLLPNGIYRAKYVIGTEVVDDKPLVVSGRTARLDRFVNRIPAAPAADLGVQDDVGNEAARRFLSGRER